MQTYEKVSTLGKGSYGKIFKVKRNSDGEIFACKTYTGDNPDINEIDVLTRFKHPNMLHCVDCFFDDTDKELYVILPLAEHDLYAYVSKKHPQGLSIGKCKSVLFQLASAVHFMHSNNIYHCDIKPQNILLHKNEIMVADFGLSFPNAIQGKGMRCGTLGYASPQTTDQLTDNMDEFPPKEDEKESYTTLRSYTKQTGNQYYRSDVFAIGMVLFFCLTGKELYTSWEHVWKDYAHIEKTIEKGLQARRETLDPSEAEDFAKLAQICSEACRLSQEERTPSIKQILGNDVFGGKEPIQGSIEVITLGAIPATVGKRPFNNICKVLFEWLSEVSAKFTLTNPILVLNLAYDIFIRAASLPKGPKEFQLYGCAALFCADYTINSNAREDYRQYSFISDRAFTIDQIEEAVKRVIGHLNGALTSQTFASEQTDAYLAMFYLYGVTTDATNTLSMDSESVEKAYMESTAYHKKALKYSKVKKVKFDVKKQEISVTDKNVNVETISIPLK